MLLPEVAHNLMIWFGLARSGPKDLLRICDALVLAFTGCFDNVSGLSAVSSAGS